MAATASSRAAFEEHCKRALEFSLAHFLHDQAVFFAERLSAALPNSDEALRLLASAHLRAGAVARARQLLEERRSTDPQLCYLLAHCCLRLDRPEDVEPALLACCRGATSSRARVGPDLLAQKATAGPSLFLLGQAKERLQCQQQAAECYSKCLEICPFMWCAYERLSRLALGLPGTLGNKRSSASQHFCEERFQRDPVISASESKATRRPSVAAAAPEWTPPPRGGGPERPQRAAPCSDSLPDGRARKRRRSDSSSPVQKTPETPRRLPLVDRAFVAAQLQTPLPVTPMPVTPLPAAPVPTPTETPVRFLARLSPRRLLARGRSWEWTSPLRSPTRSPLAFRSSPPQAAAASAPTAASGSRWSAAEAIEPIEEEGAVHGEKEEPSLACLLRMLGDAVHARNSYDCARALKLLEDLPAREHATALVMGMTARCHFEMAEYQQAAQAYARCCEAHKLHHDLGLEYYSTALWHLRQAVPLGHLAQQALDWDRTWPQSWCAVGNCLSLQQEHERAIRAFRRAVQVDPAFAYAYTLIAHEYAAMDKFDKAIETYEHAITVDSQHYNAWWGLGNVYFRQEEFGKAQYHFQKAAAINANNSVLKTSLGMVLQCVGEPERALQFFSSAVQSHPPSALASFHRGGVLVSLGRHEEALEELLRAQGLAPREPCVQFQLGRVYSDLGDTGQALTHFTRAMDVGDKDAKAIVAAHAEIEKLPALSALRR